MRSRPEHVKFKAGKIRVADRHLAVVIPGILLLVLLQCGHGPSVQNQAENDPSVLPVTLPENGEALARKYCQTCHLFPEPALLDRKTWVENVLPNMGSRLGIRTAGYDPAKEADPDERSFLRQLNVYPDKPLITKAEWLSMVEYYHQEAPQKLPVPGTTTTISSVPAPFAASEIKIGEKEVPQVTLLKYDPDGRRLYVGDHLELYALDQKLNIKSSWQLQTPAVDMAHALESLFVLGIGTFSPSDKQEGVFFPLLSADPVLARNMIIEHLPRPVQFAIGDVNGDGRSDVVVCGFSNHQGKLAWYDGGSASAEHVLTTLPGARKAVIQDLDGDGKPEIIALMAQAWEKLSIYHHQGGGVFKEETALSFPPVYGVSYFELADFNRDGHPDVLLTNGDNWDYSPIDKPYHGIRIFMNDGQNRFKESYFFPMYGCSEARALDFDQDGDLDLVAIAFYNNLTTVSARSFVYLENTGNQHFVGHYMPEAADGRWLTMDVGDFNQDGYTDVFLGSYFHNLAELTKSLQTGITSFPQIMMLTFRK